MVQPSQVLNHCPPPSRIFHGRQTVLDAMHQFFARNIQKQKIYVLYGLGGAGKTQIALKFIEGQTSFTNRLLVDASTTETIETGLQNIAAAKESGNSWQEALDWLCNNQDNWLLFFDNADDPAINLHQFLPKCNHGNIIITSRNPNLRVYGEHSQVSDMEELDAVALLLKSANQEALWYLPLAIVQAGAFISESGSLNTYLDLFIKNHTELLKTRPTQTHDDYTWAVYTTWETSFRKLSHQAAMFLQLCSFLHRDDIFEEIFSRAVNYIFFSQGSSQSRSSSENKAREFLSHFLGPTGEWDSLQYLKLINEIKAYSLINCDIYNKSFSIHPLVHSWSQTTLADQQSYYSCIGDIVGMSIGAIPQGLEGQGASFRLVSHLTINFSILGYAHVYRDVGRHTNAAELEIIMIEKWRKLLGDDHLNTLAAMTSLALTYHNLGWLEESEDLYVVVLEKQMKLVVLEKQRKLLGDDHLDTLASMHSLAITYGHLGRWGEAKKLQVVVLEKRRKLLGNDDLGTLVAMNNLAITYDKLGQFEEAKKLKVVVLENDRQLFGDNNLVTLAAMDSLALTYHKLNQFGQAETLYVVVLEKRRNCGARKANRAPW
ncbi:P-loop containing nucleoside triphosphate hydrolase protein [Mycena haematopus]|nr:P-loop containing nucleoside triphosphate hydrolase protein [Mycena haematopus]